jgi:hypothetical protein
MPQLTVLVIGGYGTFGARLVKLLADEPRLEIIVAGRSLSAATELCGMAAKAALVPALFDRAGDVEAQLARLRPNIVVDASGPFQHYDDDPYRIVRAALAAGADYLDLADAADFVIGIGVLDELAKQRGRFALSGVSSFPVLSAAVVRKLANGLDRVDTITAGVAPSPHAGVGLSVVRAIASYAGKPIAITEHGRRGFRHGFVDSRRLIVNVPGRIPLPAIRFGLIEVPDLQVLARDWPDARSIWIGAGPTPALLHRLLWGCAWLVRLRVLPSLRPFARIMNAVINTVRWGEHRGGMIVEVSGRRADGRAAHRAWHLLAEGDDGPFIPSIGAEAIVRHVLDGRRPAAGARSGHHDLELDDYAPLLAKRAIYMGARSSEDRGSLYEQALGEAADRLSRPVRDLHRLNAPSRWEGRGTVIRGSGVLAALVGAIMRFPRAQAECPVTVELSRAPDGKELWRRTFGRDRFSSTHEAGRGRWSGLVVERFGPLAFAMAVVEEGGKLRIVPRYWSAIGIPMPSFLGPRAVAFEHDADGRFNFDVAMHLPLVGLVVHYRGWLEPVD